MSPGIAQTDPTDQSGNDDQRPRVLIADDDPIMARLLELHLTREHYRTAQAPDGLTALEIARLQPPDLALVDLMLPAMSGFELLAAFQGDPRLKAVPVVIVTGQGRDTVRARLLEDGATDVFTKPFSPRALLLRIAEILGR